jgi:hypothetical protein
MSKDLSIGSSLVRHHRLRCAVQRLSTDLAFGAFVYALVTILIYWRNGSESALNATVVGSLLGLAATLLARSGSGIGEHEPQEVSAEPIRTPAPWQFHRFLQGVLATSSALLLSLLLASLLSRLHLFVDSYLVVVAIVMALALIIDLPLRIGLGRRGAVGRPVLAPMRRRDLGIGYVFPLVVLLAFPILLQALFAYFGLWGPIAATGGMTGPFGTPDPNTQSSFEPSNFDFMFMPVGSPEGWATLGAILWATLGAILTPPLLQGILLAGSILVPGSILAGLLLDHASQSPVLLSSPLQSPAPSPSEEGRK